MDSEIVKGKPLTKEQTKSLLGLIEGSKVITTKTTNATNNKLKTEEWIRLAERFNVTATNCPRTPQQLHLKWENLKKNSRKRSTQIRMNQIKTGGGPADYIPPGDILDRVTSLLESTVSGFTVPLGGDKEMAWFDTEQIVDSSETTISTPLSNEKVKKKFKPDENRTATNTAIAEYYSAKKQCLNAKLNNINLENDYLKLKNIELTLNNEKLMLETEKLKLELERLRKQ
ncbi:unnamed protein product [Parnassius apollo]|uniref:Regulatory protein zeste n=1 Tax=Parnassius apollo TaxID=110799 RepID=A0A8S3WQF1_PARAO|nr:unnamed protein product [Parnassius apollo]